MIRNPILKVLSVMRFHRVQALLMGGQACVFYGAAEFSRDIDFLLLAEAHYAQNQRRPTSEQIAFWLKEARTPSLLVEVASRFPNVLAQCRSQRPLLSLAVQGKEKRLTAALDKEEKREREVDREYWEPLRKELETLRHTMDKVVRRFHCERTRLYGAGNSATGNLEVALA